MTCVACLHSARAISVNILESSGERRVPYGWGEAVDAHTRRMPTGSSR